MMSEGWQVGNLLIPAVLLHPRQRESVQIELEFVDRQLEIPQALLPIREKIVELHRQKGRVVSNNRTFCWAGVSIREVGGQLKIAVKIGRSEYLNNLIHTGLDEEIGQADPSIPEAIRHLVDIDQILTPEGIGMHPLSSGVGQTSVLITADNQTVLTRRSSSLPVQPGRVHTATAEALSYRDLPEQGEVNLNDSLFRALGEEVVGQESGIKWGNLSVHSHGLSVDRRHEWPGFLFEIRTSRTWGELEPGQKYAPDKWERQDIWSVPFTPEACAKRMRCINDWTGFGALALTLSLMKEFGQERVSQAFSLV